MQVSWETLQLLSETKRIDVWYLFPLEGVVRQLAHDFQAIDAAKAAALDRIFGETEWRQAMYEAESTAPLFDYAPSSRRSVTPEQIEAYFKRKLDKLFSFVSDPLPLFSDAGAQKFSLFLLIANDSPAAIQLAKNGVRDVLKKHSRQAFHRTSGR